MADTKTTALTELAAAPAVDDWLYIVDKSDTTDGPSGSSRKISIANTLSGVATAGAITAAVSAHEADTTGVHGITDTSVLATATSVATAVSAHEADTTGVHGIADTSLLATATDVSTAVSTHSSDTTAVHGIADTSLLATAASVATAVSTHEADTTSVHGITDTTTLYRSGGIDVAVADGGTGASTAATARTNLGVAGLISFSYSGNLAVAAGTHRWYPPSAIVITNVIASVGTAPATTSVIVDVNISGTTAFTTPANRPTIAAAANADTSSVPDVTAVSTSQYLTVDIDQIGTGTVGADLTVTVAYTY